MKFSRESEVLRGLQLEGGTALQPNASSARWNDARDKRSDHKREACNGRAECDPGKCTFQRLGVMHGFQLLTSWPFHAAHETVFFRGEGVCRTLPAWHRSPRSQLQCAYRLRRRSHRASLRHQTFYLSSQRTHCRSAGHYDATVQVTISRQFLPFQHIPNQKAMISEILHFSRDLTPASIADRFEIPRLAVAEENENVSRGGERARTLAQSLRCVKDRQVAMPAEAHDLVKFFRNVTGRREHRDLFDGEHHVSFVVDFDADLRKRRLT